MINIEFIIKVGLSIIFSFGFFLSKFSTNNLPISKKNMWKYGFIGSLLNLLFVIYRQFIGNIFPLLNNLDFMLFYFYFSLIMWYLWYEFTEISDEEVSSEFLITMILFALLIMISLIFLATQSIWFSDGVILLFAIYGAYVSITTVKNMMKIIEENKFFNPQIIGYLLSFIGFVAYTGFLFSQALFIVGFGLFITGISLVLITQIVNISKK